MLGDRGAALDPVAAIDIADAEILVDRRVMDVAADDAVDAAALRLGSQRLLEGADIVHCVLDLVLRPLRQRPIGEAKPPAQCVEVAVDEDGEVVGLVAGEREPARMLDHEIEDVAVNDEIAAAVRGLMDRSLLDLDAAEMGAVIVAQEFVVVAREVDYAGALARLTQDLLHDVIVRLRPVPAGAQLPAVDDVADQIDRFRIVITQEVEQAFGLAAARAEMNVRNEKSTEQTRAALSRHDV